ncbi:MAG: DegT/DnrJ/EryC1/StrS family aminotransferase [Microcystis sp. M53603_WE2]|jgi:dTDP-4-amino-4,6-dideoxygalactose transaminase|uniref:Pleiotropic regulatory protein n=1 Tax=Microcystis aeruginosa PCC 9717 TaxID=1160286 RepID=I4FKL9_MICAE|nr:MULTISPECIES: DegT/DnrJ/EryC1/StrS family aminotransferase [Microcystis]MCE2663794.1 DegT/DnrJ/EryC1/StrS family aminotransferase [Microcystis sp. 53602_E8]MCZ8361450.1 DegT/DnrJ/EryC1/StrS family aminotransferase [Microcystis sp. LE19-251.1A]MCZ8026899.1 DegT/DnrJ/EryC1/StrS family aminotransferase [Microcystis sp. LE19-10.1B]MDJ0542116.1 DegT/DnrJ/EryC1/StrS family aminotransferase [Microcystis sp. M53603_WE2]MDJ0605902.1 DegT/DnrJ/EryC1/StrS family aminotransferase [Microcystis sp. M5360
MNSHLIKVPFVDLTWQNQPLQAKITEAIQTVIDRGDFVLGQALAEFETAFAQACGVEYAVGVASGTAALALALQAYGIGAGDEVLVPANTFVATLMGVIQAGAKPVLVDCHLDTALIDLAAAAQRITPNTRAILPVHLYGQMVSPQQLQDFARSYNLIIFEDAAQAHLASREGYRAGSVGVAAGFSFYPSKNLGAFGNGGMLVSNDPEISQKARGLRNYGAPSKYFHTDIGTNSRLDSIQAAILNIKLPHLEGWNRSRQRAARQYDRLLAPLADQGILPVRDETETGHVYHLYVIRILPHCPVERQQLQEQLTAVGIQTGIHYPIPCHLQPAYRYLGYQQGDFPNAEILCEEIVSLPMYPGISEEQIEMVVEQITAIIG